MKDGSFECKRIYLAAIIRLQYRYPFTQKGSGNVNRSFISTAIVNDSLAYGDDLRKYLIFNSDPVFRTYPTTAKPTLEIIFSSSLSSKPLRSKDYHRRLKSSESESKNTNDSFSMPVATRFRLDS